MLSKVCLVPWSLILSVDVGEAIFAPFIVAFGFSATAPAIILGPIFHVYHQSLPSAPGYLVAGGGFKDSNLDTSGSLYFKQASG